MELSDYLRVARRRWQIIVAVFLLSVTAAAAITATAEPQYRARAQLYVSTVSTESPTDLAQGSNFTQRQVTTYADIATTPFVLNPVIETLGLDLSPQQLAAQVSTQVPANTVLLNVAVTDPDPNMALQIADAVNEQLVTTLAELDQVGDSGTSPVKATIVTPASVDANPVSPRAMRNMALAAVLGLLFGIGLALIRDLLDTSIRNEQDARALTDAPIIGGITFDKRAASSPMLIIDEPHHTRSEAFRTLRTNLQFVNAGDSPRSIVFSSSLPEEGKTTTIAHLALTLAANGQKVCVVEGDLRRPRLMKYLGIEGAVGLTNALIGEADLEDMLQPYGATNVTLLAGGPIPPNPAELLGSERMKSVLSTLQDQFDVVMIDAPPLLPVTDAAVLAQITDGVIIVVGAGVVKNEHLEKTLARLEQAQGKVLGLILNRLPVKGADSSYEYGSNYAPAEPASSRSALRRQAKGA